MTPERERGRKCTQNMIERWWFHENQKRTTRESQQTNENDDKEIPMSCHQQEKQSFVVFVRQFPEGCLVRQFFAAAFFWSEIKLCSSHQHPFFTLARWQEQISTQAREMGLLIVEGTVSSAFEVEKRGGFEVMNDFLMGLLFGSVLIGNEP